MSELKKWFDEASTIKVFSFNSYEYVISRGFKITHYLDDNSYTIQDTRHSDFYNEVSQEDMNVFINEGFLQGTKILMYNRNTERVDKYLRLIESLYSKKAKYKKSLHKNKAFYTKRISNCNKNIHDYHDLMQFYRSKVEQFEKQNQQLIN